MTFELASVFQLLHSSRDDAGLCVQTNRDELWRIDRDFSRASTILPWLVEASVISALLRARPVRCKFAVLPASRQVAKSRQPFCAKLKVFRTLRVVTLLHSLVVVEIAGLRQVKFERKNR